MTLVLAWLIACGEPATPTPPSPPPPPAVEAPSPEPAPVAVPEAAPAPMKLNADRASEAELMEKVPGMTPKMAHEIEEYRPFKSVKRFQKELGKYADEATVQGYLQHLYVPVDLNASDPATLRQLPGLDEAEVEALVAGRPYADRAAAEAALEGKVDDVDTAKAMLAGP